MRKRKDRGFTLIGILFAMALQTFFAAATLVAVNPSKNFEDTRNAQRNSDVSQILNAVTQYTAEQGHSLNDLGTIPQCPSSSKIGTATGNVNLYKLVDAYIAGIPKDPSNGTDTDTNYTICRTDGDRVEISAPGAENGKTISVKR